MPDNDQRADGPQIASRVDKPWGYQLIFAVTPSYAGGVDVVKKGQSLSLQYHEYRDETLYLHEGKLQVQVEDNEGAMSTFEVRPGWSIRFCATLKHRVTALEDSVIFEVSTPHLEDIVRVEDRYGRVEPNPGPCR
jgi:mannose-6-phosphate isomerase